MRVVAVATLLAMVVLVDPVASFCGATGTVAEPGSFAVLFEPCSSVSLCAFVRLVLLPVLAGMRGGGMSKLEVVEAPLVTTLALEPVSSRGIMAGMPGRRCRPA
jgi:hypothetical protein